MWSHSDDDISLFIFLLIITSRLFYFINNRLQLRVRQVQDNRSHRPVLVWNSSDRIPSSSARERAGHALSSRTNLVSGWPL